MKISRTVRSFNQAKRLLLAALLVPAATAFAADEACTTCGGKVSIAGDFTHRKEPPYVTIQGAGRSTDAYREDVDGTSFVVTISNLPAGTYTIEYDEHHTGNPLAPPVNIPFEAGHRYTVFLTEPFIAPTRIFAVQSLDDGM